MKITITLKRWRIMISSIAVGSGESGGAVLAFFENRCIRSFHRFFHKRGQLH